MSDDFDKLWFQRSLAQTAINRAREEIQKQGRSLPCRVTEVKGSIVTVEFEVTGPWVLPPISIPKAESQWIRTPTQIGDYGITVPADTYLGGISGLGGGTANLLTDYGNLSTLVFVPVAATGFPAVNVNAAYMAGPQGAVIGTTDGKTVVTVDETGVTITAGGQTWSFTASGFTMATGVVAETHIHAQGNDSHGDTEQDTGPPIA